MCLLGVVVRRYIDFLILRIPTPLASALFCSSILLFLLIFKMFFVLLEEERRRMSNHDFLLEVHM